MNRAANCILPLLAAATLLQGCGGGGGAAAAAPEPAEFAPGSREPAQLVASAQTGADYPVYVYLPADYHSSTRHYPVLYALDGQRFDEIADIIDEAQIRLILVSIDSIDSDRRELDYTLPGARDYFSFLTLELIPFIESQYRIDSETRALAGHSYGGLFTGVAVLLEDPLNRYFDSVLSSDGSFWFEAWRTIVLEEELALLTSTLPVRLIATGAMPDGNFLAVIGYTDMLEARGYGELELERLLIEADHNEVRRLSFRHAIDVFFAGQEP